MQTPPAITFTFSTPVTRSFLAATALAAALLLPLGSNVATAGADTIGISGGVLIYGSEGAETLSLVGTIDGTDLLLSGVTPGIAFVTPGCAADGANARCALAGFGLFEIIGSIFDDVIDMSAVSIDLNIWGNDGHDVILSGSGDDVVFGGRGHDILFGGPGSDILFGDAGDDVVFGEEGDDIIFGGSGSNVLTGGAGDNVVFPGGGDNTDVPTPLPRRRDVPEPTSVMLLSGAVSAFFVRRLRARR